MEKTKTYTVEAKVTLRIIMDEDSDLGKAMDELESNIGQSDLIHENGCILEGSLTGFKITSEGKPSIEG